jgi:hypothetical protein
VAGRAALLPAVDVPISSGPSQSGVDRAHVRDCFRTVGGSRTRVVRCLLAAYLSPGDDGIVELSGNGGTSPTPPGHPVGEKVWRQNRQPDQFKAARG